MAKAPQLKTVNITLSYRSGQDLHDSFKMLKEKLTVGFRKDKGTVKGNHFSFHVLNQTKEYKPDRLEDFGNGMSEVYQSKINVL